MSISSVLVADSSQTSRNTIKDILVKRGYRVYQASDGSGAMRTSKDHKAGPCTYGCKPVGTDVFETGSLMERRDFPPSFV